MWKNIFRGIKINLFREILCFGLSFFCFGSIETPKLAVSVKMRNNRNKRFVSDSAETSFGSIFGCFESKLVSLDTLVASCRFKSNFISTNQSVLLSVSQWKVLLNTWTRGLNPVFSHPTFLPLASLSYCLSASVRCPSTPGLGS